MIDEPLWSDTDGKIYCTLPYFEATSGRSYQTVRQWITTSQARSVSVNGMLYVHLGDARKLDRDTPRQRRKRRSA